MSGISGCDRNVTQDRTDACADLGDITVPTAAAELSAALGDIREIFGQSNYWRTSGEPLTEDSWTNYDRIAPRYAQRLAQWQRGEITSVVDGPR